MRRPDAALLKVLDEAKRLLAAGDIAAALGLYDTSFTAAVDGGDHFAAANIAHMAGVNEPDLGAKHRWNELALREADAEPDRESLAGSYASLYNNLAFSHAQRGDRREALRCLRLAWANVDAVDPGPYADRVRSAIRTRLDEFEASEKASD